MKKIIITLAAVLSFSSSTFAESLETKYQLVEQLIEVSDARYQYEMVMGMMKDQMQTQMESDLSPQLQQALDGMLSWDELMKPMFSVYAEVYSEEELRGLIAFYDSPIGKAFLIKSPIAAQKSMAVMQEWMAKNMAKMKQLAKESIEEAKKTQKQ
ncbi:DUF2059 domain-containing protein [Paraneptunicella aestuarii]|uniref:DUF2059 domain-containing protein n=1 Tax=Paraneptunicella aestuarii TaxID=2831148 RepID=UPI001E4D9395|nr:DUF2059 domain-containing protein [Paraneptunicella aestuarii]UAA37351.1 DUF2059 domain-containing protein [Paraneptunicella aestuarii]